jgi:TP901 family phage tail tape measure protein
MAQQVVISFNANANFSDLIGEVRRANAEIGTLQSQLNGLGAASYGSLNNLNRQFIEGMRNTRLWSSSFVDVANETREFGRHLDQGRLKLKDYFREFNTQVRGQRGMIRRLAEEQVRLQRSILTTTVGPQGEARNILSTPTGLDRLDPSTMKALRAEQFKIIGKAVQGVSTELINLGKNTQWAGRQLTVGLTVPLTIFASQAAMAFKEVDQQLTRLAKVYGDIGGATTTEIASIKKETSDLARSLASSMGAAATETIGLAADIAATGKTGNDLLQSVSETTRLAVLGEVDRQEAMSATLSLQSAFNLNTRELAESINFLNAVENQTSTSLQDLVIAIPKAGPVVRQLGGDVKDLALFLTAMREGGINASEGANALKSGLASIINPTQKTRELMNGFGIDIQNIVNSNAGDLVGTVSALKDALNTLNPLARAQAIEQIFGKFQFARMSALFDNLGKSGSQTVQVMKLMGASTADLAAIADRELTTLTESASGKFQRQMETLKANMALAGEGFLGIFSKVLGGINNVIEGFNKLPDGAKTVITIIGAIVGLAGPLIMLSGVFLNFIGYVVKSIGFLGRLFTSTKKFEMLDESMMALKLSGDKATRTLYNEADAAEAAGLQIQNLINKMRELTEIQDTYSSGAVQAPGFAGASRYMPTATFGRNAGLDVTGGVFSHDVPETGRKRLAASLGVDPEVIGRLGSIGGYLERGSRAADIQGVMNESMPSMIFPQGTAVGQMREKLIGSATTEEQRTAILGNAKLRKAPASDADILAMSRTIDEYADFAAQHVATMEAISDQYGESVAAGRKITGEMKKAWQASGQAEDAVAVARNFSPEVAQKFDETVTRVRTAVIAGFQAGGAEGANIAAAEAEVKATTRLEMSKAEKTAKSRISRFVSSLSQAVTVGSTPDVQTAAAVAEVKVAKERVDAAMAQQAAEIVAYENQIANTIAQDSPKIPFLQRIKAGYRAGGIRGGLMGAGVGKGYGSGLAMMGLGLGTSMVPQTGKVGDLAGGAMMGASMGMMFGGPGMAVGAALGALVPAIKMSIDYFKKLADIQALSIKQYQIDKEYAAAAGLSLKTIGDIQLTQVTGKSQEAASALEILAKAAMEAATSTSTGALREKTKGADTFKEVQDEFLSQYLSYIAAGVSEETAKQMMAAILKAAGKEGFATDLKMLLAGEAGTTQSGALKRNLERIQGGPGSLLGTQYSSLISQAGKFGVDQSIARNIAGSTYAPTGFNDATTKYLTDLQAAYQKLDAAQRSVAISGLDTKQAVEAINNSMANSDAETFAKSMEELAGAGLITQDTIDGVADSISGLTRTDKTVLQGFIRNGVDAEAQALALKMRIEGIIPSLEAVKDFDGMRIRAYFEVYQANEALDKAKSDLQASLQGMFSGGATSGNNDAAKKAIQAQIDALEEIERKEKNINRLKELSLKYEERRRSLVIDYLGAVAGGDLEGALRAQVDMQAESAAFAREKAQTEKEIARENKKKALQDKLKALDNSAGAAVANTANKAKELENNIDSAIKAVLAGFQRDGKVTVSFKEFTESQEFKNFESKFKGALSGDALKNAMETLKASFRKLQADLANIGGIVGDTGTARDPRDISATGLAAGVTSGGNGVGTKSEGIRSALSRDQKDKILNYLASRGQSFADDEIVTIFGETYRYDKSEDDLIRREKKWMGGKIRGYYGGGYITGAGNSVSDSINIAASNKEFMMNARAVSKYGVANMEKINNRTLDPRVFENMRNAGTYNEGDVKVSINEINITDPGCSPDEIIAKIKKDLGAAVKRSTDMRYMKI